MGNIVYLDELTLLTCIFSLTIQTIFNSLRCLDISSNSKAQGIASSTTHLLNNQYEHLLSSYRFSYLVSVNLCLLYRVSNNPPSSPKPCSAQCLRCCYFVYFNLFTNEGYILHIYHLCIAGPLSFQVRLIKSR